MLGNLVREGGGWVMKEAMRSHSSRSVISTGTGNSPLRKIFRKIVLGFMPVVSCL